MAPKTDPVNDAEQHYAGGLQILARMIARDHLQKSLYAQEHEDVNDYTGQTYDVQDE